MKKLLLVILLTVALSTSAEAQQYDLRQYPSAGLGAIIMAADLPPSWYFDVWINPSVVGGQPQGAPSFTFVPHPTGQQRLQEVEAGNGVGVVMAYAIAWEPDRTGNRIIRAMKYPIVRYIGQVPDYSGYYWSMYIGLYELGVRWSIGPYY